MKKTYRTLLIIGAIGVALFGAGYILSKINIFKGNKNMLSYIEKTYENSSVKTLELSELSDSVTVVKGTEDKLVIVYHVPKDDNNVSITENASSVKFERQKSKTRFFNFDFSFNSKDYKTTVTLPKDFNGELNITTTSGSIKISEVESSKFYAKSSSGSIKLTNIVSESSLEAYATSGSISVEGSSSKKVFDVETSSGSIHTNNITCETLIAKSTSGSVSISNSESLTSSLKATSGSVKVGNFTVTDSIGIITTSGSVSLTNLKSNGIKIEAASGSVKGNIVGRESDYIIQATTHSGSNNLKDSSNGTKDLHVYTTSGSIRITFSE